MKKKKKDRERGPRDERDHLARVFRRNLKPRKCGRRWHLILFHLSKPVLYRC